MRNFLIIVPIMVYAIVYIVFAVKTKHPLKYLFFSALSGIVIFITIKLFGGNIGITLPLNTYTVSVSAVLGLPGVVLLLLLNIILV